MRDLFAISKRSPLFRARPATTICRIQLSSPHSRCVEISVPRRPRVRARSGEVAAVESRRLPRQRPRPLRGVPQPAQWHRCDHSSRRFAGGPDPEGSDGQIPNITQAGIGDYSERDIARVLETGDMPNGDSVGGAMRAVVRNTSELAAQDRAAIALYVKSLPPAEGPKL